MGQAVPAALVLRVRVRALGRPVLALDQVQRVAHPALAAAPVGLVGAATDRDMATGTGTGTAIAGSVTATETAASAMAESGTGTETAARGTAAATGANLSPRAVTAANAARVQESRLGRVN